MFRLLRVILLLLILYFGGFAWFANNLPGPAGDEQTDGIVVLTGGKGRLTRGFALIERGLADRMLISGVAQAVRPQELAASFDVSMERLRCCVDLGRVATDTRTNGEEVADWVQRRGVRSIRIVTNDWHMPRARKEISWRLGSDVEIIADGVPSAISARGLFLEYNKFLVSPFGEQLGLE